MVEGLFGEGEGWESPGEGELEKSLGDPWRPGRLLSIGIVASG